MVSLEQVELGHSLGTDQKADGGPPGPDPASRPLWNRDRPALAGGPVRGEEGSGQSSLRPDSRPVPDYLLFSICNLLCCCLPVGIAALLYSVRTRDMNSLGKTYLAKRRSKTALVLNMAGTAIGVTGYTILVTILALQYTHN
ncbi:dispanin subfamily A member 2b-like [Heptranchias perlo]|uniref:dispanin subfamily A member 2b-like n=1 Tax=Heptranchias perlo TaxID=212740 RepID=UPI00355A76A2